MGFGEPRIALSARDTLSRLMVKVLDQERPPYRYGTVDYINPDLRTCGVKFDPADDAITVTMGAIQPTQVGQVVRVSGRHGDLFISDVIGKAATTDIPSTDLPVPSNFTMYAETEAVTASWDRVSDRSEIQFAEDEAFTLNVRSFETLDHRFRLGDLNPGTIIWARVRGMTNGGAGPWTEPLWRVVRDFPEPDISDGAAPTESPDALVTGTLGWLMVEWLPVANPDPLTYELHISTTSGFTPSAATKLGETSGTFYAVATLPNDGGRLAYDTIYFVRIIAKDRDGAAPVGVQGSGEIERVDTGDAGNIGETGDGVVPSASPAVDKVTAGIGFLYAQWTHIVNNDAVTYDVHISTESNFTPSANTLIGETPSTFTFIRNQGPGQGDAPLVYGTVYYVKLWAKDYDGYAAAPGAQASGATLRAVSDDISDLAIETLHLADLAVTGPKVSAGIITSQHLVIGSFDNLIMDPNVEQLTTASLTTSEIHHPFRGGGVGTWTVQDTALARSAGKVIRYGADPGDTIQALLHLNGPFNVPDRHVSAAEGDTFFAQCWSRMVNTGNSRNRFMRAYFISATGAILRTDNGTTSSGGTTYEKMTITTLPAPASTAHVVFIVVVAASATTANAIYFDDFYARRMVEGSIVVDGTITARHVAANTITANEIATGTITAASAIIADAAIGTAKIVDASITVAKIADLSVSSAKIQDLSVVTAKIADLAVNDAKIANLSVTTAKIADAAITNAKISSLVAEKITAGDLTGITITGVTMTGGVVRTSSGSTRVEMGPVAAFDLPGIAFHQVGAIKMALRISGGMPWINVDQSFNLVNIDGSDTAIVRSHTFEGTMHAIKRLDGTGAAPMIMADGADELMVRSSVSGSFWRSARAQQWLTPVSTISKKRDLRPLRESGQPTIGERLAKAESMHWKYKMPEGPDVTDADRAEYDRPNIGPMIEDLITEFPELVSRGGLNLNNMIGLLWGFAGEMQARMTEVERRLPPSAPN